MILLIPISPEVPKSRRPRFWPGLLLSLILAIVYMEISPVLQADKKYLEGLSSLIQTHEDGRVELMPEAHLKLKQRPLLKIVPSRGDWSFRRLLAANFIHGSFPHLLLNMVGVFAGARICSTFMPFSLILAVFMIGGTLGLFVSTVFTQQISIYIPHLGASAGIFTLMGMYYVFNFHYRTKYFFWFPSKYGLAGLRTHWFFFVDVVLLEIILSAAQLFPGQADVVDHFAHVMGFAVGATLALALRTVLRWPAFIQTKSEYLFWRELRKSPMPQDAVEWAKTWMELLRINKFNDLVKENLLEILRANAATLPQPILDKAVSYIHPTFIRLNPELTANTLTSLLMQDRSLSKEWLERTPYDCVIRIARFLVSDTLGSEPLARLLRPYQEAHQKDIGLQSKLGVLLERLKPESGDQAGIRDNSPAASIPRQSTRR